MVDPTKILITDYGIQGSDQKFVKYQYDKDDMAPLWQEVNKVLDKPEDFRDYRGHLAGNIEQEYKLDDSVKEHVNKLLIPLVEQYGRFHQLPKELLLGNVWVNFQKKHEFNPPHLHDGTLSFVIWLQIPFTHAEEDLKSPGRKAKLPLSGKFGFLIVQNGKEVRTAYQESDQTQENSILLFPSDMMHFVNPFYTSDDLRITISANYYDKAIMDEFNAQSNN
jgi:hypothetical protein